MNKESFRKLGIILNENIPTQELLAEDFDGEYYGLTKRQTEKIRALRDIVTEYNRTLPSDPQVISLPLSGKKIAFMYAVNTAYSSTIWIME